MTRGDISDRPDTEALLSEVGELAKKFGWPFQTIQREAEVIAAALIERDPYLERIVWVYDTDYVTLRCLLIGRQVVKRELQSKVFELCARVNEGLPSGCMEYSFEEDVLVFRASTDLDWGPLEELVESTTSRVLELGKRYAPAIAEVLAGGSPADAAKKADKA